MEKDRYNTVKSQLNPSILRKKAGKKANEKTQDYLQISGCPPAKNKSNKIQVSWTTTDLGGKEVI